MTDIQNMEDADTLVVAASLNAARFFLRRKNGYPLEELKIPKLNEGAESGDTPLDEDAAAQAFFKLAARYADKAAADHRVRRLVLCAPPYVLCALRNGLSPAGRQLLARELTQDISEQGVNEIDAWLKQRCV